MMDVGIPSPGSKLKVAPKINRGKLAPDSFLFACFFFSELLEIERYPHRESGQPVTNPRRFNGFAEPLKLYG